MSYTHEVERFFDEFDGKIHYRLAVMIKGTRHVWLIENNQVEFNENGFYYRFYVDNSRDYTKELDKGLRYCRLITD